MQAIIAEDPALQSRIWRWQRAGWVMMALAAVAALAGLTGAGGPWSSVSAGVGPDRIELPRVTRWDADDDLRIFLAAGRGETEIGFGSEFARSADIRTIMPEATQSRAAGGFVYYTFSREPQPSAITFRFRVMRPDLAMRTIISIDGRRVSRSIIVLP